MTQNAAKGLTGADSDDMLDHNQFWSEFTRRLDGFRDCRISGFVSSGDPCARPAAT